MLRTLSEKERAFYRSLLESMGLDGTRTVDKLVPFNDLGWGVLEVPDGAALGRDTFSDLAAIVAACGDDELAIADTYSPQPNDNVVVCNVDYYEFKSALAKYPNYKTFDTSVIGRSGKWVMILRGLDSGLFLYERDLEHKIGQA